MDSSRRNHIIALIATLLFHALVVVILVSIYLRYSPAEEAKRGWPPVDSSEVLFGGEFVMIGDSPEQSENSDESAPVQFGKSGSGSAGQGKAGSLNGNSNTGALSGTPGFNLKGRTMDSWQTPPRGPLGTITVRVSVNRQGQVTAASYQTGTGAAAANAATRQSCVTAARASRFSVDNDAPAIQTGTITYRFQ